MTSTRTALVIGGGIAGPATAMALTKAGIETTIYEARPDGADGNGVMLTLATNGIDALRAIDADRPAVAAGFPTPGITLRTHTGKRLGLTATGGALADGTLSHTIRRADLYQALHRQALGRGIQVVHGKRLVDATTTLAGVRAAFADGTSAEADILVGCDGIHSTVRRLIDPTAPAPAYAGLLTTGGYASGVTVPTAPGDYEMIFGKRAFFGYAVAPDGQVWWFVNLPRKTEPAPGEVEAIGAEDWRRTFAELYADDAGPALKLIAATEEFAPMTPVHTYPHLARWYSDRMVVVGDAAHAPSPTSGQGASLSIEDAVVLATALRDLDAPMTAFRHFEAVRRPRVEKIIKAAARINNNKAPGPLGRFMRDLVLPPILRATANAKSVREVHEHHLDWQTPTESTTGVNR
ncbi:NAD(P)/FAD-dependent oxidoreductase [Actinopolymorpha sp. NPDC004070]|uniref:FAD-dependent oxidoreductase n=1 Tax=Actinopolymorpha sp. NPDC004070 TaxID=3154548 RepID=UPI0033B4EE29